MLDPVSDEELHAAVVAPERDTDGHLSAWPSQHVVHASLQPEDVDRSGELSARIVEGSFGELVSRFDQLGSRLLLSESA